MLEKYLDIWTKTKQKACFSKMIIRILLVNFAPSIDGRFSGRAG
jgi:hypothetical protein